MYAGADHMAEYLAWLDAVEAEIETISGKTREALRLIGHAEDVLASASDDTSPDWFTWFSPVPARRLQGQHQLKAGHLSRRGKRWPEPGWLSASDEARP